MLMCLDRDELVSELASLIALWLLQSNGKGVGTGNWREVRNRQIQRASHQRQRLGHLKSSALDALVKACEVFECWSMRSLRWACLCSYALL